jgi:hypothetical protein
MIYSVLMLPNEEIWAWRTSAAALLAVCFTLCMAEEVAAQPQEEPAAVAGNPPTPTSLDRLSATRDRPLFSPSRRPPPAVEVRSAPPPRAAAPQPPAAPQAPPNLTFFGTFESNDEVGAIVQVGNEKATTVRFGSYIEGWRVTEISRHRLALSLDDRTAVFSLFSPKGPGAPPTVSQNAKVGEQQPQPRLDGEDQDAIKRTNNPKQAPRAGGGYDALRIEPRQLEKGAMGR